MKKYFVLYIMGGGNHGKTRVSPSAMVGMCYCVIPRLGGSRLARFFQIEKYCAGRNLFISDHMRLIDRYFLAKSVRTLIVESKDG